MNFTSDIDGVDKRRREDVEDLQNEIAGRETGRRARFLPNGPRSEEAERKKREERAFQTRLAELLADPIYRAKYETAIRVLNSAEQATEAALAQIDIDLAAAHDNLRDIQDRAARLPDGTRVYRDADGNIRREDGSLVDAVLVDTILWTGDEPSFEAYRDAVGTIEELERAQKEVEGYRDRILGPSRDRIMDEDNPPSSDELDQIIERLEDMPDIVRAQMPEVDQSAAPPVASAGMALPSMGNKPYGPTSAHRTLE